MMSIKINVVSIIIGSKLFLYFSVSKKLVLKDRLVRVKKIFENNKVMKTEALM